MGGPRSTTSPSPIKRYGNVEAAGPRRGHIKGKLGGHLCSKGKKTFQKVRPQLDAVQTKDSESRVEYRPGEEMSLPAAETALNFPEKTTHWRSSRFLFGRKGYDLHVGYSCMNALGNATSRHCCLQTTSECQHNRAKGCHGVERTKETSKMMLENEHLHRPNND